MKKIFLIVFATLLLISCKAVGHNSGASSNPGDDGTNLSAENGSKDITAFSINGFTGTINATDICVTVPYGTVKTDLTPIISVSTGATVSPSSGVAQDFTDPVIYKVTSVDGTSKNYKANVNVAAVSAKDITAFSILDAVGSITGTNISLTLPNGTTLTSLIPAITHTGTSISPAIGVAKNFTNPVTYTVIAADNSTKDYMVNVAVAASSSKDITSFSLSGVSGLISGSNISVTLPSGTSLSSLTPSITHTGVSVSPVSGLPQNFTNPMNYTVTAADSTTKIYTVIASVSATNITFNMIYVPGGLTFKAGQYDTTPTTVANAFLIGETPVTYELWDIVRTWATDPARGANVYSFANIGLKGSDGIGDVTQPVTSINWRTAMVWTNALTEWNNAQHGTSYSCAYYTDPGYTTPIRTSTSSSTVTYTVMGSQDAPYVRPNATGFRMLTSAEWELAARYKGANSGNGAYEWPVGSGKWWTPGNYASGAISDYNNKPATRAVGWFIDSDGGDSGGISHPVKGKNPNALGLYDMSGNIDQWCFDWFPNNIGSVRVARGGNVYAWSANMQIGYVNCQIPYAANPETLRIARTQ